MAITQKIEPGLTIGGPRTVIGSAKACRRWLVVFVGLFCGGVSTPLAAEDKPFIEVRLAVEEIFTGESVDYTVEVHNVKNPPVPDLSALRADFEVKANGDQSKNMSSTTIINGKISQQNVFSHLYQYRLTPRRSGVLTIPGPTVDVNGKKIVGPEVELRVVEPEEQDLVIPEIVIDRKRVYPTQPFEVTLQILVRPLPGDSDRDPLGPLVRQPPHLEINWLDLPSGLAGEEKSRWLQGLLSENGVGFTLNDIATRGGGFFESSRAAVFQLQQGRKTRPGLDGQPVEYFAYELTRLVTPERSGRFTFGPATVKGTFVSRSKAKDGRFSGKRLVAVAPAVELEVREVPEPRPATFCGGIGDYRVAASASPTELRVGDPLTLTLEFERTVGSGSLELIAAPDLTAIPAITDEFEIVDRNPTGRVTGEVKRFAYALRPKRPGVAIPALSVALFDPVAESFTDVSTKPISLKVTEASRLGAGELVGALSGAGGTELKSREQGIYQNVTDLAELSDQTIPVTGLAEVAAGIWGLAGGLILVLQRRRRQAGDLVGQRRQQARRQAEKKLAEARQSAPQATVLRCIRAAVLGLIADLRNVVAEGLTAVDADRLLTQAGVSDATRADVRTLLESIESAEYGSAGLAEATALLTQADGLIPRLARELERRS
ncbi:MAG: BatD family protein [Planctomycetes bacterium]|nr:BatD family protein [Planctomycetota bacterium]